MRNRGWPVDVPSKVMTCKHPLECGILWRYLDFLGAENVQYNTPIHIELAVAWNANKLPSFVHVQKDWRIHE